MTSEQRRTLVAKQARRRQHIADYYREKLDRAREAHQEALTCLHEAERKASWKPDD